MFDLFFSSLYILFVVPPFDLVDRRLFDLFLLPLLLLLVFPFCLRVLVRLTLFFL